MVDTAILRQWVVNVGRRDAKCRIAHLLCEMATRLHASIGPQRVSFPFAVTQTQLADITGLTVVHVNRVLKALREGGLADVRRHEVVILDWDGLVEAGDFDADYLQTDIQPEERMRIVQAVDAILYHDPVAHQRPVEPTR
jgi:hypothetical protein